MWNHVYNDTYYIRKLYIILSFFFCWIIEMYSLKWKNYSIKIIFGKETAKRTSFHFFFCRFHFNRWEDQFPDVIKIIFYLNGKANLKLWISKINCWNNCRAELIVIKMVFSVKSCLLFAWRTLNFMRKSLDKHSM